MIASEVKQRTASIAALLATFVLTTGQQPCGGTQKALDQSEIAAEELEYGAGVGGTIDWQDGPPTVSGVLFGSFSYPRLPADDLSEIESLVNDGYVAEPTSDSAGIMTGGGEVDLPPFYVPAAMSVGRCAAAR